MKRTDKLIEDTVKQIVSLKGYVEFMDHDSVKSYLRDLDDDKYYDLQQSILAIMDATSNIGKEH
jgi:hypothetical protein